MFPVSAVRIEKEDVRRVVDKEEKMKEFETIAAAATAMSSSGIGIIRISGEEAFSVMEKFSGLITEIRIWQGSLLIPYIMVRLWMERKFWMKCLFF